MSFRTKLKTVSALSLLLLGLLFLLSSFPWIAVGIVLCKVFRSLSQYKAYSVGQSATAIKRKFSQENNVPNKPNVAIIGAGPAGLAAAAAIQAKGIPCVVFEKESTVAPAWRRHYNRLHLHTVKMTSSLPFVPFPENYPLFPSRQQVIDYLESYVKLMKINICCEHELNEAKFNQETKEWVLKLSTRGTTPVEYTAKYLIIATGQNARKRPVSPFLGQEEFGGVVLHASEYKSGEAFRDKKVLVVGFGNSGAEIAIDLWEHNATVSVVLRSPVNIVIRDEMAKNAWILPLVHYIPTWLLICLSKFFLPKRPHGDLSKYNGTRTSEMQCHKY